MLRERGTGVEYRCACKWVIENSLRDGPMLVHARQPLCVAHGIRVTLERDANEHPQRDPEYRLHVVQVISGDRRGNDAAIKEIEGRSGRLNAVIANAGACHRFTYPVSRAEQSG